METWRDSWAQHLPPSDGEPTDTYTVGRNPWYFYCNAKFKPLSRVIPSQSGPHNEPELLPTHPISFVNTRTASPFRRKIRLLTGALLLAWTLTAFGWVWFARGLDFKIGDWSISFWMAAQGSVLIFLLLTVVNAWCVNRWEKDQEDEEAAKSSEPL
jgi:putative solute:sodium symporter small subunit